MYIKRLELRDIKSFKQFSWELKNGESPEGWHVLLGENGTGKSTFIRAAAVALIGPDEVLKARPVLSEWIRKGMDSALIRVELIQL